MQAVAVAGGGAVVPSNLIAARGGFRHRDHFEIDAAVRDAEPPRVETG